MTHKRIWNGPQHVLEEASAVLTEVMYPAADAVSLLKDDATVPDEESGWSLHAYFEEAPDDAILMAVLAEAGLNLSPPDVEDLPEKDWVAHALEGLGIVEAGKFILFGRHDATKAAALSGLKLQIEANRAFGTGHHPTTAGCLVALSRLEHLAPRAVLDIGTGSGVLAIAARKLWDDAVVVGTDIDVPSIDISIENAGINAADRIVFEVADGLGDMTARFGPFPVVLANILADPLVELAPEVRAALAPGGRVVLAGLLAQQEPRVVDAYEAQGLSVVDRVDNATWPVLILG